MTPGCLERFVPMCLCHFVPEIVMKTPFRCVTQSRTLRTRIFTQQDIDVLEGIKKSHMIWIRMDETKRVDLF